MITMFVTYDLVCKEYEKESQELINLLRNSNSKYKDTEVEKMTWMYSFTYFRKKSENSPEYYEELYKMPYEKRLEAEINKVRVNLSLTANHFYVSDRVEVVSDTIVEIVKSVTIQKILNEQELIGDESVLSSIPFIENEEKLKPMSLQEQLNHAIDAEDYMEAARLRDEIKKIQDA